MVKIPRAECYIVTTHYLVWLGLFESDTSLKLMLLFLVGLETAHALCYFCDVRISCDLRRANKSLQRCFFHTASITLAVHAAGLNFNFLWWGISAGAVINCRASLYAGPISYWGEHRMYLSTEAGPDLQKSLKQNKIKFLKKKKYNRQ